MDLAYKKALRHFRKSHQPPPVPTQDLPAFRQAEKKYKARFPPPDLSDVLDLEHQPPHHSLRLAHINNGVSIFTVPDIPGKPRLVLLHSFLNPQEQRDLIRSALHDHAKFPNETNLDTHYILPRQGLWQSPKDLIVHPRPTLTAVPTPPTRRELIDNPPGEVSEISAVPKPPAVPSSSLVASQVSESIPKLRWANLGYSYHWGSKSYDFAKEQVPCPRDIKQVCQNAVRAVDWTTVWADPEQADSGWGEEGPDWQTWHETYNPDAGIINFYQPKDTLMGHVDRSELSSTSPLVSISLGASAIFLIGGKTRDVQPIPILLRSGDIVIMSGPHCRRVYHGVPRILEDTLPEHLAVTKTEGDAGWRPYGEYIENGARININVRQVFPPGFDASTLQQSK